MVEKGSQAIDETDQQPKSLSHVSKDRRFRLIPNNRFRLIGTEHTHHPAKISFIGKADKALPRK